MKKSTLKLTISAKESEIELCFEGTTEKAKQTLSITRELRIV